MRVPVLSNINESIDSIATFNPKTIKDINMLASDALAIIEKEKIQLLIVTTKDDILLGVLHMHDLISTGIK